MYSFCHGANHSYSNSSHFNSSSRHLNYQKQRKYKHDFIKYKKYKYGSSAVATVNASNALATTKRTIPVLSTAMVSVSHRNFHNQSPNHHRHISQQELPFSFYLPRCTNNSDNNSAFNSNTNPISIDFDDDNHNSNSNEYRHQQSPPPLASHDKRSEEMETDPRKSTVSSTAENNTNSPSKIFSIPFEIIEAEDILHWGCPPHKKPKCVTDVLHFGNTNYGANFISEQSSQSCFNNNNDNDISSQYQYHKEIQNDHKIKNEGMGNQNVKLIQCENKAEKIQFINRHNNSECLHKVASDSKSDRLTIQTTATSDAPFVNVPLLPISLSTDSVDEPSNDNNNDTDTTEEIYCSCSTFQYIQTPHVPCAACKNFKRYNNLFSNLDDADHLKVGRDFDFNYSNSKFDSSRNNIDPFIAINIENDNTFDIGNETLEPPASASTSNPTLNLTWSNVNPFKIILDDHNHDNNPHYNFGEESDLDHEITDQEPSFSDLHDIFLSDTSLYNNQSRKRGSHQTFQSSHSHRNSSTSSCKIFDLPEADSKAVVVIRPKAAVRCHHEHNNYDYGRPRPSVSSSIYETPDQKDQDYFNNDENIPLNPNPMASDFNRRCKSLSAKYLKSSRRSSNVEITQVSPTASTTTNSTFCGRSLNDQNRLIFSDSGTNGRPCSGDTVLEDENQNSQSCSNNKIVKENKNSEDVFLNWNCLRAVSTIPKFKDDSKRHQDCLQFCHQRAMSVAITQQHSPDPDNQISFQSIIKSRKEEKPNQNQLVLGPPPSTSLSSILFSRPELLDKRNSKELFELFTRILVIDSSTRMSSVCGVGSVLNKEVRRSQSTPSVPSAASSLLSFSPAESFVSEVDINMHPESIDFLDENENKKSGSVVAISKTVQSCSLASVERLEETASLADSVDSENVLMNKFYPPPTPLSYSRKRDINIILDTSHSHPHKTESTTKKEVVYVDKVNTGAHVEFTRNLHHTLNLSIDNAKPSSGSTKLGPAQPSCSILNNSCIDKSIHDTTIPSQTDANSKVLKILSVTLTQNPESKHLEFGELNFPPKPRVTIATTSEDKDSNENGKHKAMTPDLEPYFPLLKEESFNSRKYEGQEKMLSNLVPTSTEKLPLLPGLNKPHRTESILKSSSNKSYSHTQPELDIDQYSIKNRKSKSTLNRTSSVSVGFRRRHLVEDWKNWDNINNNHHSNLKSKCSCNISKTKEVIKKKGSQITNTSVEIISELEFLRKIKTSYGSRDQNRNRSRESSCSLTPSSTTTTTGTVTSCSQHPQTQDTKQNARSRAINNMAESPLLNTKKIQHKKGNKNIDPSALAIQSIRPKATKLKDLNSNYRNRNSASQINSGLNSIRRATTNLHTTDQSSFDGFVNKAVRFKSRSPRVKRIACQENVSVAEWKQYSSVSASAESHLTISSSNPSTIITNYDANLLNVVTTKKYCSSCKTKSTTVNRRETFWQKLRRYIFGCDSRQGKCSESLSDSSSVQSEDPVPDNNKLPMTLFERIKILWRRKSHRQVVVHVRNQDSLELIRVKRQKWLREMHEFCEDCKTVNVNVRAQERNQNRKQERCQNRIQNKKFNDQQNESRSRRNHSKAKKEHNLNFSERENNYLTAAKAKIVSSDGCVVIVDTNKDNLDILNGNRPKEKDASKNLNAPVKGILKNSSVGGCARAKLKFVEENKRQASRSRAQNSHIHRTRTKPRQRKEFK